MNASAFLLIMLLGFAILYIIYLRIQIYISSKIVKAFQASSVIVPQLKPKGDLRVSLFVFVMLIFSAAVVLSNVLG